VGVASLRDGTGLAGMGGLKMAGAGQGCTRDEWHEGGGGGLEGQGSVLEGQGQHASGMA